MHFRIGRTHVCDGNPNRAISCFHLWSNSFHIYGDLLCHSVLIPALRCNQVNVKTWFDVSTRQSSKKLDRPVSYDWLSDKMCVHNLWMHIPNLFLLINSMFLSLVRQTFHVFGQSDLCYWRPILSSTTTTAKVFPISVLNCLGNIMVRVGGCECQ